MLGAITGDIVGAPYEAVSIKTTEFPLFGPRSCFTDDTVLTVAVAAAILDGGDYASALREFGQRYPNAGYGKSFAAWLRTRDAGPYNSWGNGSAMRVSPVAWAFDDEARVLEEAKRSAEVTHDHPEGIKGAQATALATFLARKGASKAEIRRRIEREFGYGLSRTVDEIRPGYDFDVSCQGSVPQALCCFLESTDFESAVRLAVSLGGDADTQAAIAGAVAEGFYGEVPEVIRGEVLGLLDTQLFYFVTRFRATYPPYGTMHPAYFQTRFRTERELDWPEEFVIISAYATTGERWSDERNAEADRALECAIAATGRWYRRVTGYSPTTGHAEPSWAVGISLEEGLALGRRFEQDAIYSVCDDIIAVVRSTDAGSSIKIGLFRDRVDPPQPRD